MSKYTLGFLDRVVCRVWPDMAYSTSTGMINACGLVSDILEGHGRFTVSDTLRDRVTLAAKDIEEEGAHV